MIFPFDSDTLRVTSPFGNRVLNGKADNHTGYDMVGVGSHIVTAVADGTVVRSRIVTDTTDLTWQWGNYVCVRTATGQYHYYCHLQSRSVTEGQAVKVGDRLGVMGNTGYSFGAHLHFEVRASDGRTLSPESVLGIPNRTGTYALSLLDRDLAVLQAAGVVNTPAYWIKTAPTVKYLPELLHKMAEALR